MKRHVPEPGVRGRGRITEESTHSARPRRVAMVHEGLTACPEPTGAELADYLVGRKDLASILRCVARRRRKSPPSTRCPGCGRTVRLTAEEGVLWMHRTTPHGGVPCPWTRRNPNGPAPEAEVALVRGAPSP